jgi:hypothetical protein
MLEKWSDENEVRLRRGGSSMTTRPFYVKTRISEEEKQGIRKQAEISNITVSEYIRRKVLEKRVVPQADMAVLAELRRLGGLLKHVHLETRGAYSERTADAIRALEVYTRTLERSHNEKSEKNGETSPP